MFSFNLELGKKKVKLLTTASTAIYYKQIFKEDLLYYMLVRANSGESNDAEAIDVAQKLCFVMMKQAEKADMATISADDYIAWLDTVSQMELIRRAFDIIAIYKEDMGGLSVSKKKEDEQSAV